MDRRPLGRSGLAVTRLGLGLAALGRPGYINLGHAEQLPAAPTPEAMYARTAQVLDAARVAGIGYVDAARSYGRAEEFLARWLGERRVPRSALTVGSKWGYRYTADWRVDAAVHEQKELSLARFTTQLAESRAHLDGWLDLYQIHSATVDSGCLDDPALLRALAEARDAGAYAAVGLTLSGADSARALERARRARPGDRPVFDVVQATFNLLEPTLGPALAAAHADGMGVIVKEALANGRLTDANRHGGDAALRAVLHAEAARLGCAVDQLALGFVLAQPWADVVLSGAATTAHLASHVGALGMPLGREVLVRLGAVAEPVEQYWRTRATLAWN
jgi:aryl-alcohol dehydrogenase-like predicted oxidoreductase